MSKSNKIADIIIPHHDRHDHLKECLDRIPYEKFNIVIVSGGSFAHNCNKGAKLAETGNLIFLNDDTLPSEDSLMSLIKDDYDIVGIGQTIPKHDNPYWGIAFKEKNGRIDGFMTDNINEVVLPTGFMFRVTKKAWFELGGLDENFVNGGEDSDFGLRALKKKMRIGIVARTVIHKHSQSKNRLLYHNENKELLHKKWPEWKIKKYIKKVNVIEEKMSILVTNNHLDRLGGSETFTYSVVEELRRLGHDVDVFTFAEGIMSEKIGGNINSLKEKYDLILINHNTCLEAVSKIKGKKIFTSHGIYPQIEQPRPGAGSYVAISEEVKNHMKNIGYEAKVILNGINCDRFKPEKEIREKPQRLLCMCQGEEARENIKLACVELGIQFDFLDKSEWNVEKRINEADIVVSLGRGVYEAMACGRAVIVYDSRGYTAHVADGIVTEGNIDEIVKNNCSGRRFNLSWSVPEIITDIRKYKKEMGDFNRKYALENFNIENQVNKYLHGV